MVSLQVQYLLSDIFDLRCGEENEAEGLGWEGGRGAPSPVAATVIASERTVGALCTMGLNVTLFAATGVGGASSTTSSLAEPDRENPTELVDRS